MEMVSVSVSPIDQLTTSGGQRVNSAKATTTAAFQPMNLAIQAEVSLRSGVRRRRNSGRVRRDIIQVISCSSTVSAAAIA